MNMPMRVLLPAIYLLAVLFPAVGGFAEKHCADDVVCLELRSDGGAHDLMVSNLVSAPVTVCVYFTRFHKMKADLPLGTHRGHPAWTGTIGPGKTDRALGLLGPEPDSRFYFSINSLT
ncbi:MAG TPA: hypothetical protein ENN21_10560 [Spirochaetes bacterium]|nr:hypothetical protein [Spirochaetota bacterium]